MSEEMTDEELATLAALCLKCDYLFFWLLVEAVSPMTEGSEDRTLRVAVHQYLQSALLRPIALETNRSAATTRTHADRGAPSSVNKGAP